MWPILHLGPAIAVPTYILIMSLTYSAAILWLVRRLEAQHMDRSVGLDLAMVIMICGFIGARTAHVVIESPDYYEKFPLDILKFWQGGFVFYGGAIGAGLGVLLYSRLTQTKLRDGWLDLFAPVIAGAYGVGRLGCLAAGCCFGRSCDLPWAIEFPEGVEAPAHVLLHPTQLYATAWELTVMGILLFIEHRRKRSPRMERYFPAGSSLFAVWMITHGVGRILMEHFRGDYRGPEVDAFSVSTIISFFVIAFGVILYTSARRRPALSQTISSQA